MTGTAASATVKTETVQRLVEVEETRVNLSLSADEAYALSVILGRQIPRGEPGNLAGVYTALCDAVQEADSENGDMNRVHLAPVRTAGRGMDEYFTWEFKRKDIF